MQTVISGTKTPTLTLKSHDDVYKSLKSRKSNSNTFSSSVGNDFLIQFFLISLWIFCFTVCRVRHAMNRRVKSAQTAAAWPHHIRPGRECWLVTTLGHHFQVTNQIKAPWQALKNKSGGQNKNCLKSDKKRRQLELKLKVSHINSLLPRIDFSYLGCHKTYFWVGRG